MLCLWWCVCGLWCTVLYSPNILSSLIAGISSDQRTFFWLTLKSLKWWYFGWQRTHATSELLKLLNPSEWSKVSWWPPPPFLQTSPYPITQPALGKSQPILLNFSMMDSAEHCGVFNHRFTFWLPLHTNRGRKKQQLCIKERNDEMMMKWCKELICIQSVEVRSDHRVRYMSEFQYLIRSLQTR